ncbi:MAG TPA: hypothetical protein VFG42_10965 [Baekduia sp.]|uniref:hypothetical protein n=1 Tax=Baekduia sp. TaxID=2600305 RepID=UPI002D765C49|nr:hypothetical protein [Baekduia sp.]HET6507299.1 hypothetical protein [Baekduia sp.]
MVVAVAGCGGGAKEEKERAKVATVAAVTPAAPKARPAAQAPAPARAEPLTRAQYVKRADRVCLLARGVSRRANQVVAKAFRTGSAEQAAQAIDNYLPVFAAHERELKALPRPKTADRPILDGLIKVLDGQIQALADESRALREQDSDAMAQVTKAQRQEVAYAEELGRQYGFKVCGRGA